MRFRLTLQALTAIFTVSVVVISGCASSPSVRVDYDRSVDFARYQTFGFMNPLGTDRAGYQSIVSQHLKAATQAELEARGMQFSVESPQLLVNFNANLSQKMLVTPTPTVGVGLGAGYYRYRSGIYATFPLYRNQTTLTPYKEGTLNIDVVDAAAKQLVWEGVVSGSVAEKDLDNPQAAINSAVAAAFAQYPISKPTKGN